ncbi:hypothetical protein SAMN04490248_14616 [Salinihabitans flavidus]|uniref:Uncharacterized protein n=1 Tax=Salinihabitans flavidus TaxID=569882 RepID=A0A1H8W6V1_9RHOB|nr:DUF6522 family protein [Salinihabitans flavidus]SEP23384.1 hypothetical protein SAMN04490248_14616 [Salinihabitans flavidus]
MTAVERRAEDFVIDAALLADAFGLSQEEIKARMRAGTITSRCEAGVDEDAGRWRLTFHHDNRACRFIVDEGGNILKRATFPISVQSNVAVSPR